MQQYQVKSGDTLSKIAQSMGVNLADITGYRSGNPNLIYPGEVLSIKDPTPGTQPTPNISSTPSSATSTSSPGNGLVDFKSTLDQVVNLAKQKRNALSLDFMRPFQGTVAASDFNSILGNLNQASDKTSVDLVKRVVKQETPTYDTFTMDNALYQVQKDATGRIIGEPTLIKKGTPKDEKSTNLITWDEATERGLPMSLVGQSEQNIVDSLKLDKPPAWFMEKLIAEQGNDDYAETRWDEYRMALSGSGY